MVTEYSEPDAHARQGVGVGLIAASAFVAVSWILSLPFGRFSVVASLFLCGALALWIGIWEESKVIKEEVHDER